MRARILILHLYPGQKENGSSVEVGESHEFVRIVGSSVRHVLLQAALRQLAQLLCHTQPTHKRKTSSVIQDDKTSVFASLRRLL